MNPTQATEYSCLLCGNVLQPEGMEAFITHLQNQHKVINNSEFIILASMLMPQDISQVVNFMQSVCTARSMSPFQEQLVSCELQGNEKCSERSVPEMIGKTEEVFDNIKSEPITVIKEECEETKPVKRKPGGLKGVSIMGCLDKKLLPRDPILGPCKCPVCKQQFYVIDFVTEKAYRRHLYSHNMRRFGCQCEKTWQSVKDLKMHIYSVHRGVHCEACRQTFMREEESAAHMASDPHKQEPLMCDDCGFTTTTKTTFYSHIKFHHDKNIQVCELCSKEFNGTLKLKLHKRRFHAEKKPCPICGEMIKSMWIHMKTMHTKDSDKKYQCDECGKGFVEQGKYESHKMSVHDKARPFLCRFGCGAATSDKGNRKKHEVTKHGKAFEEVNNEEEIKFAWTDYNHLGTGQC